MAIEFFTEDFRNDGYDSGLNSAFQGQLASSYTNALSGVLTANADWLGFLAKSVNGETLADAQAVKAAVAAGSFSLSGLFGAAQSKIGPVDSGNVTDPVPTLTVMIDDGAGGLKPVVIDLRAILSDLDTETWTQTDTTGGGKKAVTTTTFHTREFYTDADAPAGYDSHWDAPPPSNQDPEADPLTASFTEDVPAGPAIDLLSTASDPDGGTPAVVAGSFTYSYSVDGGSAVTTAPDFLSISGSSASIDTSAASLQPGGAIDLKLGQTLTLVVTYEIEDGQGGTATNTLTVTIAGALDTYTSKLELSSFTKEDSNKNSTDGTGLNFGTVFSDISDDWFDVSVIVSGQADLNAQSESLKVTADDHTKSIVGDVVNGQGTELLVDYEIQVDLTSSDIADGQVQVSGQWTQNVANGSTADIILEYSYLA